MYFETRERKKDIKQNQISNVSNIKKKKKNKERKKTNMKKPCVINRTITKLSADQSEKKKKGKTS